MTTSTHSDHYQLQKQLGNINLASDDIVCILMDDTFTFDRTIHSTWADVSTHELPSGNGYTTGGQSLVVSSHAIDSINHRARIVYDYAIFTASGGPIGPASGAILIDNDTVDFTVIGFIAFGSDATIADTESFEIRDLTIDDQQIAAS